MRLLSVVAFLAVATSAAAQVAPPPPPSAPSVAHDREMRADHVRGVARDIQRWARIPAAFRGGREGFQGAADAFSEASRDGRGVTVVRFNGGAWVHTYTLVEMEGGVVIEGASDQDDRVVRAVVSGLEPEDVAVTIEP